MGAMRFLFLAVLISLNAFSQTATVDKIRSYRAQHERTILNDFFSFLQIPNVATDEANIGKNATWLLEQMKSKGIKNVSLLTIDEKNIPPVVYGEVNSSSATKTIIFYAHYDGQPVNPALWTKGLHPFQPRLLSGKVDEGGILQSLDSVNFPLNEDWRIYARGASDDKAGVMAVLTAIDAINTAGLAPHYNIKFFFEGEEEQGSTHLPQILEKYKSQLKADAWIICDGPVHQSGYKQMVFGARGDTHLELKVFGPKYPLHSGHYGNWVPNPVMELSKLLASMKDDRGRVTVKGFYDDVVPLTTTEKQAIAKAPPVDEELKKRIGFSTPEMEGKNLNESINLPSLNINGIESSNVGTIQANVIPVSARTIIDLRLVLGNDWKRQQQKVIDHIVSQGFYVTEKEPTDEERSRYKKIVQVKRTTGDNAQRTPMDLPVAKKILNELQQTTTNPVLQIPTLGGSLPLTALKEKVNAITLIIPIANFDNNQHAEDENIRLKNFWEGIEMMAAIMLMKL